MFTLKFLNVSSSSKKLKISENPNFLPEGIITEILARLPVKSLLQFRCVSKSWLSLISSPQFVKAHMNISSSSNMPRVMLSHCYPSYNLKHFSAHSLITEPVTEAIDFDYPKKHPNQVVSVMGSCNGLVCIFINRDLFLWNPCTRKSKKMPPVNVKMKHKFHHVYGFGYNKLNDDYKVLSICYAFGNPGAYESEVNIYSSRTDSWKMKAHSNSGLPLFGPCKFVAGKIHSCSFELTNFLQILFDIVTFDLENEVYGMIEQPNYGEGGVNFSLEVLGECICVLCKKETHLDLWVMKEYGVKESWSKLFTLPYFNDPRQFLCSNAFVMLPSGDILLVFQCHFVVVYNPKDNSMEIKETRNLGKFIGADVYVESLVSPTQSEIIGRQD